MKEFGEGVDRMFKEMSDVGLPAPEYTDNAFMLNATIRNGVINENSGVINEAIKLSPAQKAVLEAIIETPNITKQALCDRTSLGKSTIDRAIKALKERGLIQRVGSNKTGYWKVIK